MVPARRQVGLDRSWRVTQVHVLETITDEAHGDRQVLTDPQRVTGVEQDTQRRMVDGIA